MRQTPDKRDLLENWAWLADVETFTEMVDSLHHRNSFHKGFGADSFLDEDPTDYVDDGDKDTPTSSKITPRISYRVGIFCTIYETTPHTVAIVLSGLKFDSKQVLLGTIDCVLCVRGDRSDQHQY